MKDIAVLSKALHADRHFSKNGVSGQEVMRKVFFDAMGVPEGTKGAALLDGYEKNKIEVFRIISVAVDATMPAILKNQLDGLVNFHNLAAGDTNLFTNKDASLFRVARIAAGTQDIRRDNKLGGSYSVQTHWHGVGTYVEFEQFLTGQVDFNDYIQTVSESYAADMGKRIYKAISESYDKVRAVRKHTGTFDLDELLEIVRHVKAASGGTQVTVYGTLTALNKIARGLDLSETMKDSLNSQGFLSNVQGMTLNLLPDVYEPGTEQFAIDDDALLVIPSGEKIVDVVLEGQAVTRQAEATESNLLQMDFITLKKFGVHVKQSSIYGFYKLT